MSTLSRLVVGIKRGVLAAAALSLFTLIITDSIELKIISIINFIIDIILIRYLGVSI